MWPHLRTVNKAASGEEAEAALIRFNLLQSDYI